MGCRSPFCALEYHRKYSEFALNINKHFEANFKGNLFPDTSGFVHLHAIWQMLCDAGPHPSITSLEVASCITESKQEVSWALNFFEVGPDELTKNFLLMIMCSLEMF